MLARIVPARVRPNPATLFVLVLFVIFAGYTQLAMGMEWRTEAGRIGPGFFPRVVGTLGMLLCAVAVGRGLFRGLPAEATDDTGQRTTYPGTLMLVTAALGAVLFLFVPLGAVLTAVLFLLGVLSVLNSGRHLTNVLVGVLVPIGLYLLFEVLLEAGLPSGVLPV